MLYDAVSTVGETVSATVCTISTVGVLWMYCRCIVSRCVWREAAVMDSRSCTELVTPLPAVPGRKPILASPLYLHFWPSSFRETEFHCVCQLIAHQQSHAWC